MFKPRTDPTEEQQLAANIVAAGVLAYTAFLTGRMIRDFAVDFKESRDRKKLANQ